METQAERVRRVVQEHVAVVAYDVRWPARFSRERERLLSCLPRKLIRRIEHFGGTAVPGLASKPIIDMLVEVKDLVETRRCIVPILETQGYEYFWRPTWGDDTPPFYAWFIKRGPKGERTHHIHMVESHFPHWERLLFRDYLVDHPETAKEYGELKRRLSKEHPTDRVAYTKAKTDFVVRITQKASGKDVSVSPSGRRPPAHRKPAHQGEDCFGAVGSQGARTRNGYEKYIKTQLSGFTIPRFE